jgi:hypothetical protein
MKYSDKLKDPRWQKKRLEIFERDGWACCNCGDKESMLAVHHLRYIPEREPWDYPSDILMTLCEDCHSIEYEMMGEAVDSLVEQVKDRRFLSADVMNLASGFNALRMVRPPEVMSTMLSWAMRDEEMMQEIDRRYFEYLKKLSEGKK